MKRTRHRPEQIVTKLHQAATELAGGKQIEEVCKTLAISPATYHRWREQYGGADLNTVKENKALKEENAKLKKLVADLSLDKVALKELLRTARQRVTRASLGAALAVNFDPSKLRAAGLELEASKTVPVGVPATPDHVHAEPTDNEGEVRLKWRRTVRRCIFQIQYRADQESEDWKLIDSCLRQTCRLEGLVSGVKYWFRVRACNAHGASAWSNLAPARPK